MKIIETKGLTKKFNGFTAVAGIDLEIEAGELFGFLGPNGAGKTTTISMLSTTLRPTSGQGKLAGFDIVKQQHQVRQNIGIVFQDPSLDIELTGRENLNFHGRMYNMEKDLRERRLREVLDLVELSDKADIVVKKYSGGMKRRLEIARGLMHHPKILFLDEPTLGLDPQTRRKLWSYIEKLNKAENVTIMLTTHYMDEADHLCDRIGIIDKGKIVAVDSNENLKKVVGGDVVILGTKQVEALREVLSRRSDIANIEKQDNRVKFVTADGDKIIPELICAAEKSGVDINFVHSEHPTLEDVFIHYTGRSIREETASERDNFRTHAQLRGRMGR